MKMTARLKALAALAGGAMVVLIGLLMLKNSSCSHAFLMSRKPGPPSVIFTTGTVKDGDTVYDLMVANKLSPGTSQAIEKNLNTIFNVRRIQPGHTFEVVTSTMGVFQQLIYHTSPIVTYVVNRSSDNIYTVDQSSKSTTWIEKRVSLEVTENIYRDLLHQGYDDGFVANLTTDLGDNIFGWTIDFFTEQRVGDRLNVLLEQEFIVGSDKPLWNGRGRVLVATYEGKATRHRKNIAVRYKAADAKRANYYDLEGNAMQRAFLRAPFTHGAFRVSSGFSSKRFHPILRTYTAHHGIDYAAPAGTPVAAIGTGRVIYAGWKGGFGNCIEVRHNQKYVSRYGHLSKIGVNVGQSVLQGQYLGRVGSTGLSTGPHLHFEMMVYGSKYNFLAMEIPPALALPKAEIPEFKRTIKPILTHFNENAQISVAKSLAADKTTRAN